MMNKLIFSLLLILPLPSFCAEYTNETNWKYLNLTPSQSCKIEQLDRSWTATVETLRPQINYYQKIFKTKYSNPSSSEMEIRQAYWQLISKQEELKLYALEFYLAKRRLLTPKQLKLLPKVCY